MALIARTTARRPALALSGLAAMCPDWELDGDDAEPPVPPGLGELSVALDAFAKFVRIDKDLIAVAAERSLDQAEVEPSFEELQRWIHNLAETDKDAMLLRLIEGEDVHLRSELLSRFRKERANAEPATSSARKNRRTAAELLAAGEKHAEVRRRQEAERKARERARRQREQAEARAKHLDSLQGREEEIWLRVGSLIEVRQAKEYDQALQHL